jgi:hypothetical protein
MVVEGKPSGVAYEDLDLSPGEGGHKAAMAGALVVLVVEVCTPGLVACALVVVLLFWAVELDALL